MIIILIENNIIMVYIKFTAIGLSDKFEQLIVVFDIQLMLKYTGVSMRLLSVVS